MMNKATGMALTMVPEKKMTTKDGFEMKFSAVIRLPRGGCSVAKAEDKQQPHYMQAAMLVGRFATSDST